MDNKIIIGIKDKLLQDNPDLNCINNKEECIMCSQILKKSTDLILLNNFCKCYKAVQICQECFIKWISNNNECFICRKKENNNNMYQFNNDFDIENRFELNINSNDIEDNLPDDIRILRERNLFTTCRTFQIWLNINKYKIFRYTFLYSCIGIVFYSFKETIELQSNLGNSTIII